MHRTIESLVVKGLVLLLLFGLLAYFGWERYFAQPEAEPVVAAPPPPEKVDFFIKSRVRKLFDEWKRRALNQGGVGSRGAESKIVDSLVDMPREVMEIRRTLFSRLKHTEDAMKSEMKLALREIGVAEDELESVVQGIFAEAASDEQRAKQRGGRSDTARQ